MEKPLEIHKILQGVQSTGQIDALVAGIAPDDLVGALIRNGQFFDIMKQAAGRSEPVGCGESQAIGPLWRRVIKLESPGDSFPLHMHNQSHDIIVHRGSIYVETWDKDWRVHKDAKMLSKVFAAEGSWVPIPNDVCHRFMVVDGPFIGWCTFPLRDRFTGKLIPQWDGDAHNYC